MGNMIRRRRIFVDTNGSETAPIKGDQQQQHDVKVTFIREFADAEVSSPVRDGNTESSLSSASSFQSLTSTFSSKCSSGICVDSSAAKVSDTSYVNSDIPGLDDLISACEKIRLNDKTLDLSKDLSFKLQLDDGEDLNNSGDQTFESAINENSLDRTGDLSSSNLPVNVVPDYNQDLDSTCNIDREPENSTVNDFFECATVDIVDAGRFQEANFELESAVENSVHFVSNITQVNEDAAFNENTQDNIQWLDIAKNEQAQGHHEIIEENNDLLDNNISVETLRPSNDEFDGNSTVNLPSPLKLTVDDIAVELKEISNDNNISVETLRPSNDVFDRNSTVNYPSPLKLTVDDIAVESKEISNVEISVENKIVEEITQSVFNVTADVSSVFNDIDNIEITNFRDEESITLESLNNLVDDAISSVESLKCYNPSTTLYEFNENSHDPSLPTLSSLPVTLTENDVTLEEQHENTDTVITEDPVTPSLSEKFHNIAANNILPINSISTIKEPTFLNTQKFVEESIEFKDHDKSIESIISSVVNIDKTINSDELTKDVKNSIEPSHTESCEFKKPEPPVDTVVTATVLSPQPRNTDAKETGKIFEIEIEKQEIAEIVDSYERNRSTDSNELDETVTIHDISAENIFAVPESDQYAKFLPQQQSSSLTLERAPLPVSLNKSELISGDNLVSKAIPLPDEYAAFIPQQQSTSLSSFVDRPLKKLERQPTPFVTVGRPSVETTFNGNNNKSPKSILPVDDRCNFEKLEVEAKAVANDIYNTSLALEDDSNRRFDNNTYEEFNDPRGFDFLLSKTPRKNTRRDLRAESLYVKFDPLVSNTSMLPQGNIQHLSPPVNEERSVDNDTTIVSVGTPKRNPAIAAIDRLLFYSPMTTTSPATNTALQKTNDTQEKTEPIEKTSVETINMAKELELVRSTVIQLEEQVEKLNAEALEKQSSYQEKINQLQTQLAQEIKNKNQITVVVDEYEKSISRLVAERERDRKNLDLEKAKLQEELVAAKHHLDNTESAFNDVHLKYERLKAVVATYKSNEIALKQSIQENVEIIKSLENRYEQVKEHATARLEKANQDLDSIRKQNDSETVRLQAMLRKADLKSNSLAELVEQKTKENKELAQILDEVIARVGRNKSE